MPEEKVELTPQEKEFKKSLAAKNAAEDLMVAGWSRPKPGRNGTRCYAGMQGHSPHEFTASAGGRRILRKFPAK